jgi:soluble lytic murein transglycosylase
VNRSRSRRRWPPVLLALAIALVVLAAWRGPDLYQRFNHPLAHQQEIADAAHESGVDPYVLAAVINAESGFRDDVISNAGAVGLMQVLPSTAEAVATRLGIKGKMDAAALSVPGTNIRIGAAYLAELLGRYGDSLDLALAAYNAGITNADRWAAHWKRAEGPLSAMVDFPETARYVDEVRAQVSAYRELYPDAFPAAGK